MPTISYCPICKEYHGNIKRLYYRDESNTLSKNKPKIWNKTDYLICRKCKTIILEPKTNMSYKSKTIYDAKKNLNKDLNEVITFPMCNGTQKKLSF